MTAHFFSKKHIVLVLCDVQTIRIRAIAIYRYTNRVRLSYILIYILYTIWVNRKSPARTIEQRKLVYVANLFACN